MFLLKYRLKWEVAVSVNSVLVLSISVWLIRASEGARKGPWHERAVACTTSLCISWLLKQPQVWFCVALCVPKSLFTSLECA